MKNQARWFGGSYRLINLAMCRSHEVSPLCRLPAQLLALSTLFGVSHHPPYPDGGPCGSHILDRLQHLSGPPGRAQVLGAQASHVLCPLPMHPSPEMDERKVWFLVSIQSLVSVETAGNWCCQKAELYQLESVREKAMRTKSGSLTVRFTDIQAVRDHGDQPQSFPELLPV
ncbi:hypothetical protein UY3_07700 [Chelonia mydas]|uniref:Uncharacterized protein n=1 Tax=Chelonia mydas TaxID=8469 RepID=M7BHK7_CHEMY|nr:hypothetical protein UY3_07700 [Chelonia mydas]